MPAGIATESVIKITFHNAAKGATEEVIVHGPQEYGKELAQAPAKGWTFLGAQLLD